MVATIRLPEVRLAATSTAAAGDGRVWLGPAAVRDLGVQLGDPVVVAGRGRRREVNRFSGLDENDLPVDISRQKAPSFIIA